MMLIKNIILGLITAFIIWLIKSVIQRIVDYVCMKNQGLNLSGCWYAEHGSYVHGKVKAIEIIYIWQRGEKIKYRMEQYVNFDDIKKIFVGYGITKAGVISSFYYPLDKTSKLIGCMNLQVKTKTASDIYLSGSFYEIDERKKKYAFENYPDDYYNLYRIEIDVKKKLKAMYGKNVFKSFKEVQRYVRKS